MEKTIDNVVKNRGGQEFYHSDIKLSESDEGNDRKAITCAFMPDESTFNGEKSVLPDEYFTSLKIGNLMDNEIQDSLGYYKDWD